MIIQNPCVTGKAVPRGKLQQYKLTLRKQVKPQINNCIIHPKELVKLQIKPKVIQRKIITKISAEINEIETKKKIEKTNETYSWFFKRINKIDKLLYRLIKKKGKRAKIDGIIIEKGEVIIKNSEIQRIIRDYYM